MALEPAGPAETPPSQPLSPTQVTTTARMEWQADLYVSNVFRAGQMDFALCNLKGYIQSSADNSRKSIAKSFVFKLSFSRQDCVQHKTSTGAK